ncbi:MAG: hypothetical protein WDZ51_02315 [Pirellulaceae bacterium]
MSIGPGAMGIASSLAASPLAQNSSSEVNRNQQASRDQSRQVESAEKAEKAAGVGDPEESEKTSDRDADGRRAWEKPAGSHDDPSAHDDDSCGGGGSQSKDPTGQRGGNLDLSG